MNTHPDFKELFQLLENRHVDYMVIGGYAVAFHGYPRFTQDIDLFFEASPANVTRLRKALIDFGFAEQDLPEEAFKTKGNVLTFGVAPTRVDLLNEIDGVSYAEAKANVVRGTYGDVLINFIGREDLIKNKLATRRDQDKVDVQNLIPPE
ncbi:MAG: nucleotidyltransferase [Candidatus Hydrogenedentes bacterium]|nr:nucleotidyltransferase [Candidatus Hydrogenedentota bacterium]